ncbi:magnesium/cobalt transporter CorA [Leptolyngbya sp. 7M]|uniref:magnesium/cobalt transporter CorA n=1 Tax=Leptolyngbya sp. 7M TaxID=2812896 RepID=UPI001B8C7BB1|nr:magnesium/cobalt transporter CorA [Leptolyngbya sp. 7M]QYO65818.1 magnesium/cobalt transporter CorA [Leptolyngbya sp. 7M]
MQIFVYRNGSQAVEEGFSIDELPDLLADKSNVVWVDILGDTPERVEEARYVLTNIFRFHPLTIEDCIEERNQPKVEPFPDHIYFIVHGIKSGETRPENFVTKELDGYLGDNYVVTFHNERFRSIKAVKQQLRASPFACQRGAAYLLHQILDNIVDQYMPVVDDFDISISELEDEVFKIRSANYRVLEDIMNLRRSVARLRRISARQREVLYRISHGEFQQIPPEVLPFYRDVHDHLLRVTDVAESYRDLVSGLSEIHLAMVANKTNDVMKTLAVVSAIILPLSLIAGIYGMNFEHMPELQWPWAYFGTLGLMVTIAIILLYIFWRKGWIFQKNESSGEADDDIHRSQSLD